MELEWRAKVEQIIFFLNGFSFFSDLIQDSFKLLTKVLSSCSKQLQTEYPEVSLVSVKDYSKNFLVEFLNIRYTKEKLTKYKLVLLVHILFPFMSIGRDRMQDNGGSVIIAIYRHWLRHPLVCYLCFNQQDLILSSLKNISTSKFLDIICMFS